MLCLLACSGIVPAVVFVQPDLAENTFICSCHGIVPAVVFVLSQSVPAVQLSSLRHTYPVVPETTQLAERLA